MKKTQAKTTSQQIIELVSVDVPSVIDKAVMNETIEFLLHLLTPIQKRQLLRKISICDFYINSAEKGMPESRIKSIIKRKEDIARQHIGKACEPCKKWMTKKGM